MTASTAADAPVVDWVVRTLRDQGMPPGDIRAVLAADDPELVRQHLELHRERLEEWQAARLETLVRIERALPRPHHGAGLA